MKLKQLIYERKRKNVERRLFHGTPSILGLYNILDQGLVPGQAGASYFGPLSLAIFYSIKPGEGLSARPVETMKWKNARDFNKIDVDNAFIIEVILNLHNQTLGHDEDSIAIGDAPYDHDRGEVPLYEEDVESWDKFFDEFHPNVKQSQKSIFAKAIATQSYDDLRPLAHNLRIDPVEHDDPITSYDSGTHHNITSKQKIGLAGRNRIVGAYIFSKSTDQLKYRGTPDYICTKIVYNNGGSISIGYRSVVANDYIM